MLCLNIESGGEPLVLCSKNIKDSNLSVNEISLIAIGNKDEKRKVQLNYSGPLKVLRLDALKKHPEIEKIVYETYLEQLQEVSRTEGGYPLLLYNQNSNEDLIDNPFEISCISLGKRIGKLGSSFNIVYLGNQLIKTYEEAIKDFKLSNEVQNQVFRQRLESKVLIDKSKGKFRRSAA